MVRKDAIIYLLFVGLATLFWWGRAMSSQRNIEVKLPVEYTHVPAQVVFETPLPTQLEVTLRDNGRLLRQVQHTKPTVTIPLADKLHEQNGTLQLSTDVLRTVGIKPLIQGVLLWIVISVSTLLYIIL